MNLQVIDVVKVFEYIFEDVKLDGLDKLFFGFGDEKELDAVILGNHRRKIYPLLWYVMPNQESTYNGMIDDNFTFILAHNTKLDWFNDQRFDKVYRTVLFPYLNEVLRLLSKSNRVMTGRDFKSTNYPNYSKTLKKNEVPEYWDAIEIKIDLKINNGINC